MESTCWTLLPGIMLHSENCHLSSLGDTELAKWQEWFGCRAQLRVRSLRLD